MRRRGILRLALAAATAMPAFVLVAAVARSDVVIDIAVRKFEFEPNEIQVTKGREVTLALTSSDFVHGFGLPDFGIRADLIPGRAVHVTIRPAKAGRYLFVCDNFCGDGHDRMGGVLVVNDT